MAEPNLHVALALALGVQPSETDRQLIARVERLRERADGPVEAARFEDVPLPGMERVA